GDSIPAMQPLRGRKASTGRSFPRVALRLPWAVICYPFGVKNYSFGIKTSRPVGFLIHKGSQMAGPTSPLPQLLDELRRHEEIIRQGGGRKAVERQHAKNRLTARERIARLIDADTPFFELGLWAAWNMYADWGGAPSAGVVTGVGRVAGRQVMVIANDATVKARAVFPLAPKKRPPPRPL